MSEQNTRFQPVSGGPALPPPPPPPSQVPASGPGQGFPSEAPATAKGWRPSKKLVIIASAVLLVVVAALVALFIVLDIMRGGEKTPEAAGDKLLESINSKDLVGLFTTISPHERDAVMRLQSSVTDKFKEFGVADALKKISPESADAGGSGELLLDGVEITVSGATPAVTEISEDFAQVHFSAGKVRTVIHPEQTKGLLRAALDSAEQKEVIENEFLVADLGPNQSGLTLISAKTDGRWFLSPMLSALEIGNTFAGQAGSGVTRGNIPDKVPAGSDAPDTAASQAVRNAVEAYNSREPATLAPSLVKDEAAAIYLYGDLWSGNGQSSDDESAALGDSSFTTGPEDGNRALAFVQNLSLSVNGDKVSMTESCVTDESGEEKCLNGSGYALNYNSPTADPMSMFTVGGKFGLTTVKEDGKWKVSVLDTATDMATSWVNTLTKEQALALLRVERADEPSGALTLGKAEDVTFNSAGYAVRTLTIEKAQKVTISGGDSDSTTHLYSADAKTRQEFKTNDASFSGGSSSDNYYDLAPGSYLAVTFAGNEWQEKFEKDGNDVSFSSPVTAAVYTAPPLIDGSASEATGNLSTYNDSESLDISLPEATTKNLVLTVTDSTGDVGKNLDVEISDKHYAVPVVADTKTVVPIPANTKEFTVTMKMDSGDSDSMDSYGYVTYTLGFQD